MIVSRSALASQLLTLAVLCALFVSGAALNDLGLNYSTESASGGLKLHPYTLVTAAAVLALAGGPRALSHCLRNRQFRTGITGAAAIVAILALKGAASDRRALGFAVDTLVAAFLIAAILPLVSSRVTKRLAAGAMLFLVVECTLALIEAVYRVNLIPVDTWYGEYFRATALHGHPLNNALILVTVATALQANARRWVSLAIFVMTVSTVIAFGGRGALAAYVLVNAISFARFGLGSAQRALIFLAGGLLGAAALAWLVLSGVVGDRIARVGTYDNSSQARIQSLDILTHLNWTQLLVGNQSREISRLMDQADVGVVENFLVGYVLTFGGMLTAVILYCVYRTCKLFFIGVSPAGRRSLFAVLVVFCCTALTNNSLMTKTPALCVLVVGLWCVRCQSPAERATQQRARPLGNERRYLAARPESHTCRSMKSPAGIITITRDIQ